MIYLQNDFMTVSFQDILIEFNKSIFQISN